MTYDEAYQKFTYDPDSGKLYYRTDGYRRKVGQEAGYQNGDGYLVIKVDYSRYRVARVAWLLFYKEWPSGCIDHIDRIRTNNRISNLRCVSRAENNQNRGV